VASFRESVKFLSLVDQLTDSGDAEKTAAPMTIAPVKTILRIPDFLLSRY
jgi:hypothetical protein